MPAGRRATSIITSHRGFTLLEILMVIALLAMIASVLVVGSIKLIETKPKTAEEVFWKAVSETRKTALLSAQEVRLRFVTKNKTFAFVASGPNGEQSFPIDGYEDVKIDFLSTQKGASAILIRSQLVETQTVPFVTFYGDGTCSPFRLQIRTGGPARTLSIDPWTCAQVLVAADSSRSP